jgi:hypothetical protein
MWSEAPVLTGWVSSKADIDDDEDLFNASVNLANTSPAFCNFGGNANLEAQVALRRENLATIAKLLK